MRENAYRILFFSETCQCPKNIFVGWYSYEPYISGDSTKPVGILSDLLTNTISKICKLCDGKMDHDFGDVNVFFNRTKNGKLGKFESKWEISNLVGPILCFICVARSKLPL